MPRLRSRPAGVVVLGVAAVLIVAAVDGGRTAVAMVLRGARTAPAAVKPADGVNGAGPLDGCAVLVRVLVRAVPVVGVGVVVLRTRVEPTRAVVTRLGVACAAGVAGVGVGAAKERRDTAAVLPATTRTVRGAGARSRVGDRVTR